MATNFSRYQSGGDFYRTLASQYGTPSADYVASEAAAGDDVRLQNALSAIRSAAIAGNGNPAAINNKLDSADDSVLGNFWEQITTDPLAAPLDSLNDQLGKVVKNVVGNPMVLILTVAVVVGVVMYFGGLASIKRRVTG